MPPYIVAYFTFPASAVCTSSISISLYYCTANVSVASFCLHTFWHNIMDKKLTSRYKIMCEFFVCPVLPAHCDLFSVTFHTAIPRVFSTSTLHFWKYLENLKI